MPSVRTIGRLSLYRRILLRMKDRGQAGVYSHQIAQAAGVTAAQVRRDLMAIGYSGSPNRGYDVPELVHSIGECLDDPMGQNVALVGLGNLGRAVVAYVARQRPKLHVAAAFDVDPSKVAAGVEECPAFGMERLEEVVREEQIRVGIVTVPAEAAQQVTTQLVEAGVKGILNFAPVSLRAPEGVYVEDMDLLLMLEKVAYFARSRDGADGADGSSEA